MPTVPHRGAPTRLALQLRRFTAVLLVIMLASTTAGTVVAAEPARAAGFEPPRTKAELHEHIRSLERRLDAHEARVDAAVAGLDAAEDRYFRALDTYSSHVAELYIAGETSRISALAQVRDVQGAVDAASALSILADYDRAVMLEYQQAMKAAESATADLDAMADETAAMTDALDQARTRLENWREPSKVVDLKQVPVEDAEPAAPMAEHFFMTSPMPLGAPASPAPAPAPTSPAAPATEPAPVGDSGGPGGSGYIEVGVASWYGPGFHGNTTANGETYDMYAMTAAHKTLPFGTVVRVTTDWGTSVTVRINDRGPFVGGRIIDLSYAAAQALGIDGVAPVQIEVV